VPSFYEKHEVQMRGRSKSRSPPRRIHVFALQGKGRHINRPTCTSLLQDSQTGETINISAPIWILTYMFLPVSVNL